ncbi:MAG: methyltransferase domain-containing protein [Anaerolineae bacterium]|nr:methyltransferase domain-containing protein [Anaerolineae bacterium]
MSDRFQDIYTSYAAQYDRLVSCEDYQGNILCALTAIKPLEGLDVIEMGAGTGRLTRLLVPIARSVLACDVSRHMLEIAAERLQALGGSNDWLIVGDHRHLPVKNAGFNLAIEGWSFGHLVGWNPKSWRTAVDAAVYEMKRSLRSGGTAIIIETLGTGIVIPQAPSPALAAFYSRLETRHGFAPTWIRTDYRFESLQEAEELTRFFFGETLANQVAREKLIILPECTGIWWLTI